MGRPGRAPKLPKDRRKTELVRCFSEVAEKLYELAKIKDQYIADVLAELLENKVIDEALREAKRAEQKRLNET